MVPFLDKKNTKNLESKIGKSAILKKEKKIIRVCGVIMEEFFSEYPFIEKFKKWKFKKFHIKINGQNILNEIIKEKNKSYLFQVISIILN